MTASTGEKKKKKRNKRRVAKYEDGLGEPSGSPPRSALSSTLFGSGEWEKLQGKNRSSGSRAPQDKTKPRAWPSFTETPCCIWGVLRVREDPKSVWSCDICLLPAKDTRGSVVSVKGPWKILNLYWESHLTLQPPDRRDNLHSLKPGLTLALQETVVSAFPLLQSLLIDSHVGHLPSTQLQPPQILLQGPTLTVFLLHLQSPLQRAWTSTAT